ncbi:HNH endonuclease [Rathayibacter iranicus]|nr:HNH endonuclease [Rathayibacter iranicus]MWV29854.1 HNH endonuclease [Rathayibacter iranicus NCPPB 2253 = VKM Ac-1602]PWJ66943.1 HNH endonuclease [Rathayibacter iranicus] [Rathayibacter iranicus NCPPB 2253 = VKM Ac-1602]
MHIGFRTSGGRGEYEVVGSHYAYNALGLEGFAFHMRWPDGIVRDTGLMLEAAESGKPRLRSMWSPPFQIGRMIASMLLLPDPRREFAQTNEGLPVARDKGYILSRVGFGPETEITGMADMVTIVPSFVNLDNTTDKESIGVNHRFDRISTIYAVGDILPWDVRNALFEHRDYLASGENVDITLTRIVSKLLKSLITVVPTIVEQERDPLRVLEEMLEIVPPRLPSLPPPDEIGEEEPFVSARSANQYRLAKIRGTSGRKFSTLVHAAYAGRCLFCGAVYGGVPGVRPGVDAAHILAWSKYDLDVVPNGMSLCKLHHWAFDAALLVPELINGRYVLRFTELSVEFEVHTINKLGQNGFSIPESWLPAEKQLWPSQKYLDRLYADLAISFLE